jgi:regulatory protein
MDSSILEKLKRFCSYQERSHTEVRSKLLGMEIYGLDLENYIAELISEDYLNEERFATLYAGGKFRMKQWGKLKIKQGLKLHKISAYCIQKSLAEIPDEDYERTFTKEAEKKLETLLTERSVWKKKMKLRNYLLQKGFEDDLIHTFIREHLRE